MVVLLIIQLLAELLRRQAALPTLGVSGDITAGGTVDGRDLATDGAKLDNIAANATANVGDITNVIAQTGLTGGGTSGAVTIAVDTTLVATAGNTLSLNNKTLNTPVINSPDINGGTIDGANCRSHYS